MLSLKPASSSTIENVMGLGGICCGQRQNKPDRGSVPGRTADLAHTANRTKTVGHAGKAEMFAIALIGFRRRFHIKTPPIVGNGYLHRAVPAGQSRADLRRPGMLQGVRQRFLERE